jgi:hypothetical protein
MIFRGKKFYRKSLGGTAEGDVKEKCSTKKDNKK